MRRATASLEQAGFGASDSYLRCVERFAVRPLKSDEEYRAALRLLAQMVSRDDKLDAGERDYVQGLSRFVKDYEAQRFPVKLPRMKPLEVLQYLMEENDMNTTDLGYVLGSKGLASEVLNGKRGLSKTLIRRLADRFAVDPGIFLERD